MRPYQAAWWARRRARSPSWSGPTTQILPVRKTPWKRWARRSRASGTGREQARIEHHHLTVSVDGDTFSYEEDSVLKMSNLPDLLHHTDRNTLRRTATYQLEV